MDKENNKQSNKPKIGITIGDYNGVGPEIIIRLMEDKRLMNICTPVIYGSGKILTKYKRMLGAESFSYHQYNENSYLNEKKPNVVNCWTEAQELQPGKVTDEAGECAYLALKKSTEDLKNGLIDAVVTCPINKANIQRDEFRFQGHTEYYAHEFGNEDQDTLMLLCSGDLRVGVITGHIPLKEVSAAITKELILRKTRALMESLIDDFGILKPKVAIMGMNPHAGEDGLLGKEEQEVIIPAIEEMRNDGWLVYGPYPSDGFFGTMSYKKFDGVLAMYHDQGLIPFKAIAFDSGVNYTAGLSVVRTSPDHGTAYDIAGKGVATEESLREALYQACDIVRHRKNRVENQLRPNARQLLNEMREESKKQMQMDRERGEQRQMEAELAKQEEAEKAELRRLKEANRDKQSRKPGGRGRRPQRRPEADAGSGREMPVAERKNAPEVAPGQEPEIGDTTPNPEGQRSEQQERGERQGRDRRRRGRDRRPRASKEEGMQMTGAAPAREGQSPSGEEQAPTASQPRKGKSQRPPRRGKPMRQDKPETPNTGADNNPAASE